MSRVVTMALVGALWMGCVSVPKPPPPPEPTEPTEPSISIIEYEAKTQELLETNRRLNATRVSLDDQRRRLAVICVDYPDHQVCAPQTQASYAREAFCKDREFTQHIDEVVRACHQGQCKQVDQAVLLTRTDYMRLVQRLPHALVLFRSSEAKLDRADRVQIQQFLENIHGEKGYVIIVGRASQDGVWVRNLKLALDRAEHTRKYLVDNMGIDQDRVGYITYGADKMYLTDLDVERLSTKKLSMTRANRSALIFSYPCYEGAGRADDY